MTRNFNYPQNREHDISIIRELFTSFGKNARALNIFTDVSSIINDSEERSTQIRLYRDFLLETAKAIDTLEKILLLTHALRYVEKYYDDPSTDQILTELFDDNRESIDKLNEYIIQIRKDLVDFPEIKQLSDLEMPLRYLLL